MEGRLLKQWIDAQLSMLGDLRATLPEQVDDVLARRLARASDRLDEALDVLSATR